MGNSYDGIVTKKLVERRNVGRVFITNHEVG